MHQTVLVLGAASNIAEATCRLYAQDGARMFIVGRDAARMEAIASDLRVRGAEDVQFEANDLASIDPAEGMERWVEALGRIDVALLAYGKLGDQKTFEADLNATADLIDTNFRSTALWSLAIANELEKQRGGSLLVIGSVAGDRGRQSNYVYGATKAGLEVLVQGIAHRLAAVGARAVLVKPGFVDTAMTAHISKGGPFWSSPSQIAHIIRAAAKAGPHVRYAPGYWRLIMAIIKAIPTAIFHRTNL